MQLAPTSAFPSLPPITAPRDFFVSAAEKFVALDGELATGSMRTDDAFEAWDSAMDDVRAGSEFLTATGRPDPITGWLNLALAERWLETSGDHVAEPNHVRTAIRSVLPSLEHGSKMLNAPVG